jgi:murein DD-endopeptidase MepM/ murein hydrolase activator NlpD
MQYFVGFVAVLLFMPVITGVDSQTAKAGDDRQRSYTSDRTAYSSPWFEGKHRKLVPYGCTSAPYYPGDNRCAGGRGFHHGIDFATPCGTQVYAAEAGWVVAPDSLGEAYGSNPVLIRNYEMGRDFVIGHTREVDVKPGNRVQPGDPIATTGDSGTPSGCRLHVEVRRARGAVGTAVSPRDYLDLGTPS